MLMPRELAAKAHEVETVLLKQQSGIQDRASASFAAYKAFLGVHSNPSSLLLNTIDRIGSIFLRQVLRRMKQLGLNQSALARRMKVSRPYISKVLRSDVNISFATAAKLARALQMDFLPVLRPSETAAGGAAEGDVELRMLNADV